MKGRLVNYGIRTLVGLASLALAFASADAATPQYKWKIAHIRPAGTAIDKDVHGFVDRVAKESGGRIVIEVYPASQLGDYTVVQERVSLGAIEMQVGPLGTTVDKRLNLPSAPYLAKDWKDARKLFSRDSQLSKKTVELLQKQGLQPISGWPVYFGGIVLTKEPASPGDPDVPKNIKIRVPPIKSFELTAQALGFLHREARHRFGHYEVIDFLAVLLGYAISGEDLWCGFGTFPGSVAWMPMQAMRVSPRSPPTRQ